MSSGRSISKDFLSRASELEAFYGLFPTLENIPRQIEARKKRFVDRTGLVAELEKQHAGLKNADLSRQNIALLAQENTFTVTTGHQLCFVGGPLFTVYKILTVIKTAKILQKSYPQYNFVPVFWMASEDHDAAEINHFFLDYQQKWEYPHPIQGAVGRHKLNSFEVPTGEGLAELFAPYQTGNSLAEAFRKFIHTLFGPYGLVILDGDSPALKRALKPVFQAEFTRNISYQALTETNTQLENLGYPRQVHPREINVFYLGEGSRERIVKEDNGLFKVLNTSQTWSETELLAELEAHPERFSPNVALRPLYQEMVLPNLAYAGGWGELSYWLQLKGIFAAFGVPYPMLLPRFSATLFTPAQARAWQEMGFAQPDLELELHELQDKFLPQLFDPEKFDAQADQLRAEMHNFQKFIEGIDSTLGRSVAGEAAGLENFLERMQKKVKKSIRNQFPGPFQQITALKNEIQPERTAQQRVLSLASFAGKYPPSKLIENIFGRIEPFNFAHQWITLP
ncbi:MAG: bacillithiol biosynthesis cysteine-adding enzyme BshC [Bacteroidia bacterium]|nr:bacillithiol biosynthesis cysteine-adding enzyme BshC [Bacteroidia bacterium]